MCVRAGRWVQWGVARAVEERSASVNTGADPTSSRACRTAEGHEIPSHLMVSPVAPVDREKGGEIPELQNVQDDSQQGFTVLPTHTLLFVQVYVIFLFVCGRFPGFRARLVQQPREEGPAPAPGAPSGPCWGQKASLPVADTRQILLLGSGFLSERERNISHICVEQWGKGSIASAPSDRGVIPKVSAADLAKEQENVLCSMVQLGSSSTGFVKGLV